MTDDGIKEPPEEQPETDAPPQPIPHYVYAVAMMPDGDLTVVTDLPFSMQRKARASDVKMTAEYLAKVVEERGTV